MKIVCEACQAKYSIADEKVRGKVFKIRCKKCSHVIVVRGTGEGGGASGEFASSPSSAPDLALEAGWHIVVEGEQVGPLSEGDVKSRLVRGEITPETYIWKEGLPDWVKVSSLPEFASEGGEAAGPFAAAAAATNGLFSDQSTTVNAPSADVFAAQMAANGPAAGDLFAAPARAAESGPSLAASSGGGGGGGGGGAFAGYEASLPAAAGAQAGGFTGQRHENSVLFSLSNLEALAKPSAPAPSAGRAPSASSNSEGSGLIDIRAMANMTLGGQAARNEQQKGPDLPAYSAPQFSPVAPMLLTPVSATPKWLIGLVAGFGAIFVVLALIVTIKMFSKPEPVPAPVIAMPAPAPTAVPPSGAQPPATAAAPGTTTVAPTAPPPANEALPPRETAKAEAPGGADRPVAAHTRPPRAAGTRRQPASARSNDEVNNRLAGAFTSPPPKAAAEAPKKPKDDIEALLEAASGGRKSSAPARRDEDEPAARGGERLPPLGREEIVKGMNGVLPKARECYSQFKVPGVANAKITVAGNGRVSGVNVSGKFAGTPSGNCVEGAIKTARFAPSAGLTFDYPVPLR